MARKNGHSPAEETLEKILDAVTAQTKELRSGFAGVNERVDGVAKATATGLARLETRLDEIAKNTGTRYRELEARLRIVEQRLGISSPTSPE